MFSYRATFALRPELEEEEKDSILKELEDVVIGQNGKMEKVDSKMQKFAYEVDKTKEGFLMSIIIEIDPSKVDVIHQFLIKKKDIIRVMMTRQEIHPKKKNKGGKKDERIESGSPNRKSHPRS